jgi:ubiquitin carboxyl-terminal hydrolase 10
VESRPSLSPPSPTTVTTTTQGSGEPSISTEHAASSQTPSESDSTYPSTPWSSAPPSAAASSSVRLVPAVPTIIPKPMLGKSSKEVEKPRPICSDDETKSVKPNAQHTTHLQSTAPSDACAQEIYAASVVAPTGSPTVAPAAVPAPIKPMLWADLLKSSNKEKFLNNGGSALKAVNGTHRTLEDTLKSFQIIKDVRSTPFLEPRGLVNTGNMCYMNAVSPSANIHIY